MRTISRWTLHLAALLTVAASAATAEAYDPETNRALLIERAEAHHAPVDWVLGVASCETGGTFRSDLVGRLGERGVGQWLPGQAAWRGTPTFAIWRIDVVSEYQRGNDDASFHDLDMLAWAFSPDAPAGFWRNWTCA